MYVSIKLTYLTKMLSNVCSLTAFDIKKNAAYVCRIGFKIDTEQI